MAQGLEYAAALSDAQARATRNRTRRTMWTDTTQWPRSVSLPLLRSVNPLRSIKSSAVGSPTLGQRPPSEMCAIKVESSCRPQYDLGERAGEQEDHPQSRC